jgi:hypothetical protein
MLDNKQLRQAAIDFAWPEMKGRLIYDTLPESSKEHIDDFMALIASDRRDTWLEADRVLQTMMREYANMPLKGRPNAFDYLYKARTRMDTLRDASLKDTHTGEE